MTASAGPSDVTTAISADIVGLGMATVDVLAAVPQLPTPDAVLELDGLAVDGGGPVATALCAAARLGSRCAMVGATDREMWGDAIVDGLQTFGVDTRNVKRRPRGIAPRSVVLVEGEQGRRSILYSKGTVPELTPDEVPVSLIRQARVLHLDGFHHDAALVAARAAREADTIVSLDAGAGEAWPGMETLVEMADVLIAARQFAASFTGLDDPAEAALALATMEARQVVVTDGERGAWYRHGTQAGHVPALDVPVVDTTGAGDTFHGAYLDALLRGGDVQACTRFAAGAAALACGRLGGRSGLPERHQVVALLDA